MITVADVKRSFEKTGICTVDHRFLNFFPSRKEFIPVNVVRPSNTDALDVLKGIMHNDLPAPVKVKEFSTHLAKTSDLDPSLNKPNETTLFPQEVLLRCYVPNQAERNYVVSAGLPAEMLTVGVRTKLCCFRKNSC